MYCTKDARLVREMLSATVCLKMTPSNITFETPGWWFQPIEKILVKLGSSSPRFGVNIHKYLSCHHLKTGLIHQNTSNIFLQLSGVFSKIHLWHEARTSCHYHHLGFPDNIFQAADFCIRSIRRNGLSGSFLGSTRRRWVTVLWCGVFVACFRISSGWWLNQPILKNMLAKLGSSFPNSCENKKYLKTPPSLLFVYLVAIC